VGERGEFLRAVRASTDLAGKIRSSLTRCGTVSGFQHAISHADAERLVVGIHLRDAVRRAAEAGFDVRVVRVDGSTQPKRHDRRSHRINVATEAGVVVSVTGLG
jgi:hypothetical protein